MLHTQNTTYHAPAATCTGITFSWFQSYTCAFWDLVGRARAGSWELLGALHPVQHLSSLWPVAWTSYA